MRPPRLRSASRRRRGSAWRGEVDQSRRARHSPDSSSSHTSPMSASIRLVVSVETSSTCSLSSPSFVVSSSSRSSASSRRARSRTVQPHLCGRLGLVPPPERLDLIDQRLQIADCRLRGVVAVGLAGRATNRLGLLAGRLMCRPMLGGQAEHVGQVVRGARSTSLRRRPRRARPDRVWRRSAGRSLSSECAGAHELLRTRTSFALPIRKARSGRLVLDGGVPPSIEMDHVVGGGSG